MTELVPRDDIPTEEGEFIRYLIGVVETGRRTAAVQANSALTLTHWLIGQAIATQVSRDERGEYGRNLFATVSRTLTERYGKGFDPQTLRRTVQFAEEFPDYETVATLSRTLSWSHIVELLPLRDSEARAFYAKQVGDQRLSVRELRGVIARKGFERRQIADSQITPGSAVPLDTFQDPYLLDFLGLKSEYSEADLEAAVIRELEKFLLEFGRGFTFVARQKRMSVGVDHFYLGLLLYNRNLRRLVAVDFKVGAFKAGDKGQMDLYLKWLNRYERKPWEEAPIGLLLVTKANRQEVELLEMHEDGIMVAEYWTQVLPDQDLEARLAEIIRAAQERLARRGLPAAPEVDDE
jgi:predicted nuclease of restriction endonuclease-like (RecB) superfamily